MIKKSVVNKAPKKIDKEYLLFIDLIIALIPEEKKQGKKWQAILDAIKGL